MRHRKRQKQECESEKARCGSVHDVAPEFILHARIGTEQLKTSWDKTIIDRHKNLGNWVEFFRQFVRRKRMVFAYANKGL
jgi:hypothetical protein